MATSPMPNASPDCSPAATAILTALLEARTGQQLSAYRSWRIDVALKPLLRHIGADTLDQLVARLTMMNGAALGDRVVDALLNQETSFFREAPVFDAVVDAVAARPAGAGRARIWCAGCATGQEPLSLAMLFAERHEATGLAMPEIIATDVSEAGLARARAGRFSQFEIQRGLPIRRMMRWFDGDGGDWTAHPELVRAVAFRRGNLVADVPPAGRFDVILCRNVLLYLSPATKTVVFDSLARAIRPDGLLVLGAGETVIGQTTLFAPSQRVRGFYDHVPSGRPAARAAA